MKSVLVLILGVAAVSSFKLEAQELAGLDIVVPPVGPSDRIIGGKVIPITDAPWQIGLSIESKYWCGGSLISNTWVITAAHCVDSAEPKDLTVYLGSAKRTEGISRVALKKIVHSGWDSNAVLNDIALLQIAPVSLSASIKPIELAKQDLEVKPETVLTATGWGKTSDSILAGVSTDLRSANMIAISNELCAKTFGNYIKPSNLCVSTEAGTSTCNGDSGGPLVYNNILVGLTSFGSSAGCTKGAPAAFTRTSYYYDWIKKNADL